MAVVSTSGFGVTQPGHVLQRYQPPNALPHLSGVITARNNFAMGEYGAVYQNTPGGEVQVIAPTPPGSQWTAGVSAADNGWQSVCYGAGKFVAVANSGTNRVMTSPDGIAWTASPAADDTVEWSSVAYGNGVFVAVGGSLGPFQPPSVMTSPDGITWTSQTPAVGFAATQPTAAMRIAYGNGLFMAITTGEEGADAGVMISPDGVSWTARKHNLGALWYPSALTWANGRWVMGASSGTNRVVFSTDDAVSWTSANPPVVAVNAMAYGNGRWVAGYFNGAMASPDLANWTQVAATWVNVPSLVFANGWFVALTQNAVWTSRDGLAWTQATGVPTANVWRWITYGGGKFVAVGQAGTGDRVMTSP